MGLENRESVLDRVVYIEPEHITEIPFVERWCDRLDLKKHRINVGDAGLYVEEEGKGPYAKERMKTPFLRIDNRTTDLHKKKKPSALEN